MFPRFTGSDFGARKKHGDAVLFVALSVGASAPNPDTRNFSRKVSWNFKSFTKINWCISVQSSLTHLSYKKGVFFCLLFFERKVGYTPV